jgi:hypothetical protein
MNDANGNYPSGPWTGYYQHSGRRYRQDLELQFTNGVMTGTGSDSLGQFTVRGSYRANDGEVTWTKRYYGRPRVFYRGFREGKGIWGTWEIPQYERSGFHIWPVGAGGPVNEIATNEDEITVVAPAETPAKTPGRT